MYRNLTKAISRATIFLFPLLLLSQDVYQVDLVHSDASFKIRHLLSKTTGTFSKFEVTIIHYPDTIQKSSVVFTIKSDSIDTNNESRDQHLRGADFFDVQKYPELKFISTKVVKGSSSSELLVTGNFTLRGITKVMTVPVVFLGSAPTPFKDIRGGFETVFKINRNEFGIVYGKGILGDDVEISLNIEAIRK
jgi:polyisoprenoid-binding protein YceI